MQSQSNLNNTNINVEDESAKRKVENRTSDPLVNVNDSKISKPTVDSLPHQTQANDNNTHNNEVKTVVWIGREDQPERRCFEKIGNDYFSYKLKSNEMPGAVCKLLNGAVEHLGIQPFLPGENRTILLSVVGYETMYQRAQQADDHTRELFNKYFIMQVIKKSDHPNLYIGKSLVLEFQYDDDDKIDEDKKVYACLKIQPRQVLVRLNELNGKFNSAGFGLPFSLYNDSMVALSNLKYKELLQEADKDATKKQFLSEYISLTPRESTVVQPTKKTRSATAPVSLQNKFMPPQKQTGQPVQTHAVPVISQVLSTTLFSTPVVVKPTVVNRPRSNTNITPPNTNTTNNNNNQHLNAVKEVASVVVIPARKS